MKKVFIFLPSGSRYGAEKSSKIIAEHFASQGYNPHFVFLTNKKIFEFNFKYSIINTDRTFSLVFLVEIIIFISKLERSSILVLWSTLPAIIMLPILYLLRFKNIIVSERDSLQNKHNLKINLLRGIVYRLFRENTKFLFNSKKNLQQFSKKFNLKSTYLLLNSVKFDKKSLVKIPKNFSFNIVLIGRVCKQKGINLSLIILNSLSMLIRRKIKVDIFGDGNNQEMKLLKRNIEDLEYLKVNLHGFCKIQDIYKKNYDFCLSMSQHDGLPNLILEHFELNKIIFYNNCDTGPLETLGENSLFLLDYNNINSIIITLRNFYKNPKPFIDDWNLSKKRVGLKHTNHNYVKNLKKIIHDLS